MSLKTPLGRVKGLGSAKSGVSHWWTQRLTAVALLPLVLWFCFSLALLPSLDHASLISWLSTPWVAALISLLLLTSLYHAYLGLQVVIEDYVPAHGVRTVLMVLIALLAFLLAAVSLFALLRIFTGAY